MLDIFLNLKIYKQYLKFIANGKFEIYEDSDVFYIKSKINHPFFNYVLVNDSDPVCVRKALNKFEKTDTSTKIIFSPYKESTLNHFKEKIELNFADFHIRKSLSYEIKENSPPKENEEFDSDFSIIKVQTAEQLALWDELSAKIHRYEKNFAEKFFKKSLHNNKLQLFIGFCKGQAAAISMSFMEEGLAFSDWTGSLNNARLEKHLIRNSIKIAQDFGCKHFFTEAKTEEEFIYDALDFKEDFSSAHLIFEPILNLV